MDNIKNVFGKTDNAPILIRDITFTWGNFREMMVLCLVFYLFIFNILILKLKFKFKSLHVL